MVDAADWIWSELADPHPRNRFTWFRTVVDLDTVPDDPVIRIAADSTARTWVNGLVVLRKVARFHEPAIRAETVAVDHLLRPGPNVIVVLHHSWGDIVTFQRSAAEHAGLWVEGSWVRTSADWRWCIAEEYADTEQFLGVHDHTPRIRFPVRWEPAHSPEPDVHDQDFDDTDWATAVVVPDGPWPARPEPVETPPQREYDVTPGGVIAAGTAMRGSWSGAPTDRPSQLAASTVTPDPGLTRAAGIMISGGDPLPLGGSGTRYVTVDFHRPVHGYPYVDIELDHGTAELQLGYGELVTSAYDGSTHLRPNGWIDVDGVVATGYADSIMITPGRRRYELPDERTARWLTLHCTPSADLSARVRVHEVGVVSSQYPVQPVGSFRCGDRQVEQIVELCLIHAEVTMSDSYVDTPGREDGQWIEDARPRALIAERWFDDTRLRRLMIRTLAEGQNADGELHPFFPSNYPFPAAPYDWSVQWVAMIYDDYRWHRDHELVRAHFPALVRYWAAVLAHLDDDGLWRTRHVFADIRVNAPVPDGGSSGVVTPWIIDRLSWSAELARAIGDDDHADRWEAAASAMRAAFRRHHLVTDHPRWPVIVADHWNGTAERGYSQAGQAMPLLDGLLDETESAAVIEAAFPAPDGSPPAGIARWNNPTWSYRVLRGMTRHGYGARAVAHLKERYAPYLPGHPRNPTPLELQGPYGGPLPEYWISREDLGLTDGEINPTQPVDVTGSHGWGAMPLLWLHDSLLGVEIDSPGGDRLIIRPTTAGLPYVSGWTQTPRGAVQVHLDPQQRLLLITLPADVTAAVTIPIELGAPGRTESITGPGRFSLT